MSENKILFGNDTMLKVKYPRGKVADFLIESEDSDKTIIKAYTQLLETAFKVNPKQEYYGIIITDKEMYLGFGADAWESF